MPIAIFGRATETFAQKNLNRSIDEPFAMFDPVVPRARARGLWVRAYVSMCFGDPWEGPVPIEQVVDVAQRLMDLGCHELSLGDTIGVATPGQVSRAARAPRDAGIGADRRRCALPRHLRPGAGQHAGRPARRGHDRRCLGRRPRRLPVRQERHRQPRHRGPRLGLDGAGIETGVDLEALSRPASGWRAARPAVPEPRRPSSRRRRAEPPAELNPVLGRWRTFWRRRLAHRAARRAAGPW